MFREVQEAKTFAEGIRLVVILNSSAWCEDTFEVQSTTFKV